MKRTAEDEAMRSALIGLYAEELYQNPPVRSVREGTEESRRRNARLLAAKDVDRLLDALAAGRFEVNQRGTRSALANLVRWHREGDTSGRTLVAALDASDRALTVNYAPPTDGLFADAGPMGPERGGR